MERESAWLKYDDAAAAELEELAASYIDFISENKTERACAAAAVRLAEEAGYRPLSEAVEAGAPLRPATRCGRARGVRPSCWRMSGPSRWSRA